MSARSDRWKRSMTGVYVREVGDVSLYVTQLADAGPGARLWEWSAHDGRERPGDLYYMAGWERTKSAAQSKAVAAYNLVGRPLRVD